MTIIPVFTYSEPNLSDDVLLAQCTYGWSRRSYL